MQTLTSISDSIISISPTSNEADILFKYSRLITQRVALFLRQFKRGSQDFNELFEDYSQEARMGLLYAHRNYDPDRGTKFLTHATNNIDFFLQKYRDRRANPIRIPAAKKAEKRIEITSFDVEGEHSYIAYHDNHNSFVTEVAAIINNMPEERRAIARLTLLDDMSCVDAAKIVEKSPLYVRKEHTHIVSLLRDKLISQGYTSQTALL